MTRPPRHSGIMWRTLELAFPLLRRIHLHAVHIHAEESAPLTDRVLLIGNHCSWWDGFMHWRVARHLLLGRPHYTIMLEEQIKRSPALRGLGTIGIVPGSVSGVRSAVDRMRELREREPRFSVSLFPQGAIWPSSRRPLGFKPGAAALARPLLPCSVLPVAVHMEPGTRSRPSLFVLAGPPRKVNDAKVLRSVWEPLVTATLDRLLGFLHRHGESAGAEWPPSPVTTSRSGRPIDGQRRNPDRQALLRSAEVS